jgi:hypothetical protein
MGKLGMLGYLTQRVGKTSEKNKSKSFAYFSRKGDSNERAEGRSGKKGNLGRICVTQAA